METLRRFQTNFSNAALMFTPESATIPLSFKKFKLKYVNFKKIKKNEL